jgi:predicted  nucleic acid-binding Zn-ribbon protein
MPNKCTRCGKIHPDEANYLLKGCDECGSKFFFYVKPELLSSTGKDFAHLNKKEIDEIEDDVREIISEEGIDASKDETVVLDFEAINIIEPGKYEIDVVNLFNQKPLVIKVGSGKYNIDLSLLAEKWKYKNKK